MIKKRAAFTLPNRERPVPLPKHSVPYYGSDGNTAVPGHGKPERENVGHQLHDPKSRKPHNKKGKALLDKPSTATPATHVPTLCTVDEDTKHHTPDCGSYSSTAEPVPVSNKPGPKTSIFETVKHQLPDPPRRRPRPRRS